MLKTAVIVASALVFAAPALAQSSTVKRTPGHMEQARPSKGPGASDYAPGHEMQAAKSKGRFTGPGASSYAPGQTTGSTATRR